METDFQYGSEYDYNYTGTLPPHEEPVIQHESSCFESAFCVSLLVAYGLVVLLGSVGNGVVIWISGFKMKRSVNTTWYLSLAISDFVFCAFLPFTIAMLAMERWVFGLFLCKFASSVMFLNMFSSIYLLVIISVDRCVSVVFPVWAQNHRTVKKASAVVVLAWVLAIGMSVPSMIFREVRSHMGRSVCFNNYMLGQHSHKIVAFTRFLAGFVVPFVVILICYSVIILKLCANRMTKSSKPFKVMTALVVAFFVCWLPYHTFVLLEQNHLNFDHDVLNKGLNIATCLAAANSLLNPVLYVFMGNDFKRNFKHSLLLKMESAMRDERQTISRYLSSSSYGDRRASTNI